MIRTILIVLIVHIFGSAIAQLEADITLTSDFDTLYIKSYTDLLAVKLYGVTKSNEIRHVDDFTNQGLSYKPNEKFNIGFGFNYKWWD